MSEELNTSSIPTQFQLPAEADGIAVVLDARRTRSLEMLEKLAELQKNADENDVITELEMFDFILGDQKEEIKRQLTERDGYVDYTAYLTVCEGLFKQVLPKN